VLLGASNLTRAMSTVVGTLETVPGGPWEIVSAAGHGRSYGMASSLWGRQLPGIVDCGLWDALAASSLPTSALLTDIGNDLLYGAAVDQVVRWVEMCLDRLAAIEAEITITGLPLDRLHQLSRTFFYLFRTILFPRSQLTHSQAMRRATRLDSALRDLAIHRSACFIAPSPTWYGIDPIHIRRRDWSPAWRSILEQWPSLAGKTRSVRGSLRRWWPLQCVAPERMRRFGIAHYRRQPDTCFRNGTTVAMY